MVLVQREIPGGAGTAAALFSATFPVAQLLAGALTGLVAARTGYSGTFCARWPACCSGRAGRNLPG